jgi:hypothetical protein
MGFLLFGIGYFKGIPTEASVIKGATVVWYRWSRSFVVFKFFKIGC